jgi:hypothetical protein
LFKEKIMRKLTTNPLIPAVSLLCLLVLAACPPDGGDTKSSGNDTDKVIIKGIPDKVGGQDSYKIYIQFSEYTDDDKPHTAISSGKIEEHKNPDGSVTLSLFEDEEMTTPWTGSGSFYIAITISPKNAPSADAIEVRVPATSKKSFSSEANTIDWQSSKSLKDLGSFGEPRIQAIYDLIIKKDPDITTP